MESAPQETALFSFCVKKLMRYDYSEILQKGGGAQPTTIQYLG